MARPKKITEIAGVSDIKDVLAGEVSSAEEVKMPPQASTTEPTLEPILNVPLLEMNEQIVKSLTEIKNFLIDSKKTSNDSSKRASLAGWVALLSEILK